MPSFSVARGKVVQAEVPLWSPLEAVLGTELAGWFMWMYEVRLDDGTRIDVYKHVTTRHYLHLADNGSAFAWRFDSSYQQVDLVAAIVGVFEGWGRAMPTQRHQDQLAVALASAQGLAA